MKLSLPRLAYLFFFTGAVLIAASCSDDDGLTDGEFTGDIGNPQIDYIRSTDPALSDSLLTGAFMGQLIAIVGKDLQHTVAIWFNDQEAELTPPYVTETTILVNVPSTVPGVVTDKMRLIFADDSEMEYDFAVNVPGPVLNSIKSEYVESGDIAVLSGDFFFEPTTVIFPGDKEAQIATIEKTRLEVVVPENTEMGEIIIETNFGTAVSSFLFRDNRNVVVNGDDLRHRSWNAPVSNITSGGRVSPCSGNYIVLEPDSPPVGAWSWQNSLNMMYVAEDGETGRGNIPIFPGEASVSEWGVRFEINVQFEWREIPLEIFFANYGEGEGRNPGNPMVRWSPWEGNGLFETDGWETVTVPLSAFDQDMNGAPAELSDLSTFTNMTIMFFGAADNTHEPYIALDNVRVVRL